MGAWLLALDKYICISFITLDAKVLEPRFLIKTETAYRAS